MEEVNPTVIALEAFSRLDKKVDDYNNYLHMKISFSDDVRAYIFLCPILYEHVIIHEEYDMDRSLDDTWVLSIDLAVEYIKYRPNIIYVGLRENPTSDDLTELYRI